MTSPTPQNGSTQKISADLGAVMLVQFEGDANPYKALYVGMEAQAYIILRFPPGAAVEDYLYEGSEAVVKYISEGKVFGFPTTVAGYIYKKKLILVVLSFPTNVQIHRLRKEHRVDFTVPAELKTGDISISGLVVDISPGGCKFSFDPEQQFDPIDPQAIKTGRIMFQVVGRAGRHEFACTVMNVKKEGPAWALGLRFDEADEEITNDIRDYVSQVSMLVGETAD